MRIARSGFIAALLSATAAIAAAQAYEVPSSAPAQATPQAVPSALDDLVPPDATSVFRSLNDGQIVVTCATTLDHDGALAFYRAVLEKQGWRFIGDFRNGRVWSYGLGKGEKGEGLLLLTSKGDSILVLLSLKE